MHSLLASPEGDTIRVTVSSLELRREVGMTLATQQVHRKAPGCPACGGRLFLTDEYVMGLVVWFWECSLGCSMQYHNPAGSTEPLR